MTRKYDGKTLRNVFIFTLVVLACGWLGRLVDLKVGSRCYWQFGATYLACLTTTRNDCSSFFYGRRLEGSRY